MKSIYTTTTKYVALAFSLLLAACTTDLYEDKETPIVEPEEKGLNIPDDFDFSVLSTRTITVNVVDEYDGQKDYIVEGYDDNPVFNPSAKLLFRRKTNEKYPCVVENVTFLKTLKTIYIQQTDPYGLKTVYTFQVEGEGDMVCDLKPAEAPETKAAGQLRSAEFSVDFDKGNAITVTNASQIQDKGKYCIPQGTMVTINSKEDWKEVTLYVEGTLELKVEEFEFKDNCQIYVLKDGKIIGNYKDDDDDDDDGVDIKCKNGTDIYNQGVIEGIDDLSMEKNDKNNDCVIYNEGTIKVNDLEVDGTRIFNYCLIEVKDEFESEGAGSILGLYAGAFLCHKFKMSEGPSKIVFGPKAILKGQSAEIHTIGEIIGAGDGATLSKKDWAVFQFNTLKLDYTCSVSRCVEFACKTTGKGMLWPQPIYSSTLDNTGKIIPSFEIEATPCNGNTSNTPDKRPEDTGGSTTEKPGEKYTYTFVFEDNWPAFGDYDMNDIVLDVNVANQEINKEGNAKSAIITASLLGVGATKDLYLFVRSDNMVQNEIPLFDGKEAHACMGDFNRSQMINTEQHNVDPAEYKIEVELTGGTLSFGNMDGTGQDLKNILDVFIVWGDPNAAKRNEIHLKGFPGTDRAKESSTSVDYQYKSDNDEGKRYNKMMWGLMLPKGFKYPTELNSIMDVYPDFVKWAQSGGKDYQDWYKNAEGSVFEWK